MSDGFQPASIDADGARRSAMPIPRLDPESALVFVINASAGAHDVDAKRAVIESTLAAQGRRGELLVCGPDELARVATAAAAAALARGTAVVAVGGDGSLGTVAQAAHAAGCPMGVIPYGTFNYFARTHGIPTEPAAAARQLLDARPHPVQVGAINDRVFLVNASLASIPNSCRIARPTRPASAVAAGWRSSRAARRCCVRSAGCACTSRPAPPFATCRR